MRTGQQPRRRRCVCSQFSIAKSGFLAYSRSNLNAVRFLASSSPEIMIVGTEWIVDAAGCDREKLRDLGLLQLAFNRIIADLNLKVVGEIYLHQFPAPGAGITGLAMLTESHLACHTYPEWNQATFNLYCCRTRPEWNWEENLRLLFNAENVRVLKIERGHRTAIAEAKMNVGGNLR